MRRNCLLNSILCMHKQAAGACWYLLGIQRAAKCLKEQCGKTNGCGLRILSCKEPIYYGSTNLVRDRARLAWAGNREARSTCLDGPDKYNYGAYKWTVQLVTNDNRLEKILFPIFWGLMTLRYPHFLFPWPTTWFCMMNKVFYSFEGVFVSFYLCFMGHFYVWWSRCCYFKKAWCKRQAIIMSLYIRCLAYMC